MALIEIVVNPISGRRKGEKIAKELAQYLQKRGKDTCIRISLQPKTVYKIIEKLNNTNNSLIDIVVIGGDGTIHQVANAAIAYGKKVILSVIPAGVGNDLARQIGITSIKKSFQSVLRRKTIALDAGIVKTNRLKKGYFTNILSIGADAEVAILANLLKSKRFISNIMCYPLALLKEMVSFKTYDIEISVNDKKPRKIKSVLLVAAGIGTTYGRLFKICPDAIVDDGLLDICIIKNISFFKILRRLPCLISGTHPKLPEIEYFKARKIIISSLQPLPIQADGEIFKSSKKITLRVDPRKLLFNTML